LVGPDSKSAYRPGRGSVPAGDPAAGQETAGAGEEEHQEEHVGHEEALGGLQGGQGAAAGAHLNHQARPRGQQEVSCGWIHQRAGTGTYLDPETIFGS